MLTQNELDFTFGGFYICTNFGENLPRNATARVRTDGQMHRRTDADQFHN